MTKLSSLNGRLAKWMFLFWQYEMQFLSQIAIKGHALTDFLVENPTPGVAELYEDLPEEVNEALIQHTLLRIVWSDNFTLTGLRTGPFGQIRAGVGVVPIPPQNHVILCAFTLMVFCSNSVAEYHALLIGLKVTREVGARNLEAYDDPMIIVSQVRKEYKFLHEDLIS